MSQFWIEKYTWKLQMCKYHIIWCPIDGNIIPQRCSVEFRSSSRICLYSLITGGWALSCTRRNPGPPALAQGLTVGPSSTLWKSGWSFLACRILCFPPWIWRPDHHWHWKSDLTLFTFHIKETVIFFFFCISNLQNLERRPLWQHKV